MASSFASRASSESVLSTMLTRQAATVSQWAAGNAPRLTLNQSFGSATGYAVLPGEASAFTTFSARLVLERDTLSALGYHILTGFPTP
jgi:hypothetical protein